MQDLLDNPMVQAGVAPFLAALLLGALLQRTRAAWLALAAAWVTTVALTTGFGLTPLSASRKVLLLVGLAPLLGLALDRLPRPPRALPAIVAALAGLAALWVFQSVLGQRETPEMLALGASVAVFVALLVGLVLRLREDGAAVGGAGVALGLGVGVAAFLSASLGNFMNGIALAAGSGALMLLQFALARRLVPGWVGALTLGLASALFAASTFVLSQLPWYALPLLLLVPLAAGLPVGDTLGLRARKVVRTLVPLAAASATILAAWLATRAAAA